MSDASSQQPKHTVPSAVDLAENLNADEATDVHAFDRFESAVRVLIENEDFGQLEQIADSVRSGKVMFSGGTWKLHAFYLATAPYGHPTEPERQAQLKRLNDWVSQKPLSITARVALAQFYVGYAWDARGGDYADSVTTNGWDLFRSRLAKARAVLEDAAKLNAKCPEWYLTMQHVAQGQQWSMEQTWALLQQAIAFQPEYYYFYRMHADILSPQWHGEPGDSEKFAAESADRVGGKKGDILYFQVAANLICYCGVEEQLKNMSWPRIKKGFAELEESRGIPMTNMNLLAVMATKLGDPLVANEQFQRIGDQWSESAWRSHSNFNLSREWARRLRPSRSEIFVKIDKDGEMENILMTENSSGFICLFQLGKKMLSPPSYAPFWIKLRFDPPSVTSN